MKFRPSRAHRWVGGGCTGSVRAEAAAYQRPEQAHTSEGKRLHALAADVLARPIGASIGDEDERQIMPYVLDVLGESGALEVEGRLDADEFGSVGYVDAKRSTTERRIIWDAKFGFTQVEAFENWQLLIYALKMDSRATLGPVRSNELRIVQPNGWHPDGPVRSWVVPDLAPYAARVKQAMADARDNPRLVATPANCTYCTAVTSCQAARAATLGGMDLALREHGQLPPEAIRTELVTLRTSKKLITMRLDALEEESKARMQAGEALAGCGLRAGRAGALEWTSTPDVVESTITMMGAEAITPGKLRTPKQLIDAGVAPEIVETMAARKPAKMSVATDADEAIIEAFKV